MRRHPLSFFLLAATVALLALGASCRREAATAPGAGRLPLRVVVSIPPLRWAFEGLPEEAVDIRVIVPAGRSPHGFEPTPSDIAAIAEADVVATVGLGIDIEVERAAARAGAPGRRHVRFQDILGLEGDFTGHEHDHDHGHDDQPDHGEADPHVWLDPTLMGAFVEAASTALREALAGAADDADAGWLEALDARAAEKQAACAEIDARYRDRLAPHRGKGIVSAHGAFRRIAERYGLEVVAVLRPVETVEPTMADFNAALTAIRDRGIGAIFTEPQFPPDGPSRIAERTGVKVLVLDPVGDGEADGWPRLMRANLDTLVTGLESGQ